MRELAIAIENPRVDDVRRLVERHLHFGRSQTPPEDAHALEVDGLLDPAITLFGLRSGGELLAETGSMDAFAPARSLYASAGFMPCPPFAGYRTSPNSTYLTRTLAE